ncbi:hypothetical protein [Erythrobacter sp. WG]|uniref:hypothetical protein n=1 Tax=Erythrobacter sp. WG TaxID=2985510 RepID=UPI00226F76B0|nr:hypothetical protein [Erythrobacter sp. WG]MCX9147610.1 hypothetical protein [Erythrobacter sp. WG]
MFLVALGCIWALQGLGVLHWPADSFMLGDGGWALRGAGLAMLGATLIGLVEWRRRS